MCLGMLGEHRGCLAAIGDVWGGSANMWWMLGVLRWHWGVLGDVGGVCSLGMFWEHWGCVVNIGWVWRALGMFG